MTYINNNMENRIKIDDVWYVREDAIDDPMDHLEDEEIEMDIIAFDGRVFETDLYCFEATRILKDDGTPYEGCDIKLTDKRVKPWKEEHLDNTIWYLGVLENNSESMDEAHELLCEQGIKEFRSFVRDLINVDWLKNE